MQNEKYVLWCEKATKDPDLIKELKEIMKNALTWGKPVAIIPISFNPLDSSTKAAGFSVDYLIDRRFRKDKEDIDQTLPKS